MLSTEIHEAATELGRSLRQAPAVSAYRAAEEALAADPGAQALMTELRRLQQAFIEAQRRGETSASEATEALRRCQADVRANAVIMAHLRATNDVKAFLPLVATEVTRALGTDYGRFIAPTSC